jgi:hypothetical protein
VADNVTLNAGTGGAVVAADDIASVWHQRVKISLGADGAATDALGGAGAVAAGVQRVTLASDDPAVAALQILDNAISGSEMQVDVVAALPAGDNNIGNVDIASAIPAGANLIGSVTALGPAAENAAVSGNPVLAGGRYDSAPRTLGNGDVGAVALNASGQVLVEIAAGAGSGGTAAADDADFTAGTTSATPVMGAYQSSPTAVTDGDMGIVGITANRELKVAVSSGGIAGVVEDAVASGSAEGILAVVVRDDVLATLTPVDGDYTAQRVNARGATWVCLDSTAAQTVTLAAGTATNEVVGDAAHDAAIAGNPVRIGARAMSADFTAVATGDTTDVLATLLGKQVVVPYAVPAASWSYASAAAVTDTADDEAKAAVASTRNYVTSVQVFNGHDTTGTEVVIKDGSTVLWRGWAEQAGGGAAVRFDPPLRGTANTAINVANITNASSTYFNLQGFAATE